MKLSVYRISLDVHNAHSGQCLDMKQKDTARQISITLTDGGFPYQIGEECYAVFVATKADGKKLRHHCSIEKNTILYEVRPQTTAAVGLCECEIKLYGSGDKLLMSPGFSILVSEDAVADDEAPESQDEVDDLTHLISEATTVITEGEQVITKAKNANAETEALIAELETEKKALEGHVAAAEESAEDAASMADSARKHANTAEYAAYKALQYSKASDLAQNDPDAPGYIKNRTHWVESSETVIAWDGNVMAKRTYTDDSGKIYYKISDKCPEESDVIGATIEFPNGTIQTVSAIMFAGFTDGQAKVGRYLFLRSTPAVSAGNVIDPDAVGVYAAIINDVYPAVFRYGKNVIHPLDEKFIPDTIARKYEVPTNKGLVSYAEAQDLTIEEKAQARANIDKYVWHTCSDAYGSYIYALSDAGEQYYATAQTITNTSANGNVSALEDIVSWVWLRASGTIQKPNTSANTVENIVKNYEALVAGGIFTTRLDVYFRNPISEICYAHLAVVKTNSAGATHFITVTNHQQRTYFQWYYDAETNTTTEKNCNLIFADSTLSKIGYCADAAETGKRFTALDTKIKTLEDGYHTAAVTQTDAGAVISITDKDGTTTATITNGKDGADGAKGDKGDKGDTGAQGPAGPQGPQGETGPAYTLTAADKTEIMTAVIDALGGNPVFGYVNEDNTIILSGNLAEGSYSVRYEMEDGSTVDIGDLVLDSNVYYSVANTLTNCTTNNAGNQVAGGAVYEATLTANSGYELTSVVVTMGGVDVSADVVNGGTITIASVTGDIVITAVAEAVQASYTNLADPTSSEWQEGYRINSSGGLTAADGVTATNFVGPVNEGDVIRVKGMDLTTYNSPGYKSDKTITSAGATKLSSQTVYDMAKDITADATGGQLTIGSYNQIQGGYWRFSGILTGAAEDVIITINEPID